MSATPPHWDRIGPLAVLLFPVSGLFVAIAALRRLLFAHGLLERVRLPVSVVVVGNITAGGTGKTPLVVWLAHRLAQAGRRPGIITRGYGGTSREVAAVRPDSDPAVLGDEAVLLARRSGCPVWRGADRVAAARALLAAHPDRDCLISDDGLQHYRLARDVEIAVIDGVRGFGNALPLPAGPLREPVERLETVDAIVINGAAAPGLPAGHAMQLVGTRLVNMHERHRTQDLDKWARRRVHAVAGIGHPRRFFDALRDRGLAPIEHAFADHHGYVASDFDFGDDLPVIMTEKDAVKCFGFARQHWWYLPVEADVAASFWAAVSPRIKRPLPQASQPATR